jgi:hypothetical protein
VQPYIIGVLIATVGIFGTSALSKVRGREAFRTYRAGLRATGLLPESALGATAMVLAVAEVAAAVGAMLAVVLLASGHTDSRRAVVAALVLASAVIGALAVGVALALRRGAGAACMCFGAGRPLGRVHLVRNTLLLVALAVGVVGAVVNRSAVAATQQWAVNGVAAVAGTVSALLFILADDIADLFATDPSVSVGRR